MVASGRGASAPSPQWRVPSRPLSRPRSPATQNWFYFFVQGHDFLLVNVLQRSSSLHLLVAMLKLHEWGLNIAGMKQQMVKTRPSTPDSVLTSTVLGDCLELFQNH